MANPVTGGTYSAVPRNARAAHPGKVGTGFPAYDMRQIGEAGAHPDPPQLGCAPADVLTSGRHFLTKSGPNEMWGRFFMQFVRSRPDVVRSANQRGLLSYWNGLRDRRPLPRWQGFEAEELAAMAESLSFLDVIGGDGTARFLIRYHGKKISEAYGAVCQGKFLDEILPLQYREAALSTYHRLLVTNTPVYTIADMRDRLGRIVHYERLLLPFSRDGVAIDRILASLETASPEGAFDHRDILKSASKPPAFALCATIEH